MRLKHQAASARKWHAAIRQVEGHFPAHLPALLFLTDPNRIHDPIPIIKQLPNGSGVVYRHFGAADRWLVAKRLKRLCQRQNLYLIISADPHLAMRVRADAVHWPERLLSESLRWRGRFAFQTSSAHSRSAIKRAERAGIDGILFSTIFPSSSRSAGPPLGPIRFRQISLPQKTPIYALGGINAHHARMISAFGGLATVSGVVDSSIVDERSQPREYREKRSFFG